MFDSYSAQIIETIVGSIWESYPWKLEVDYVDSIEYKESMVLCKHALLVEEVKEKVSFEANAYHDAVEITRDKSIYRWPFVVVAYNEGRFNNTGVCGLCIVEQIEKVKTKQLLSQLHIIRK